MPKPYIPNDRWSKKAQKEGFRARSVYKLEELDARFGLLKPGMKVLDLGAAPGSWLQYASQIVGPKGTVIGIDLKEIEEIAPNVHTHQADILDEQTITNILGKEHCLKVDLILSDLAPNTSGIRDVDQWRSVELSQAVVAIAGRHLASRGMCVIKILRGADFDHFLRQLKNSWKSVKTAQVQASRDRSKEIYVVIKN